MLEAAEGGLPVDLTKVSYFVLIKIIQVSLFHYYYYSLCNCYFMPFYTEDLKLLNFLRILKI